MMSSEEEDYMTMDFTTTSNDCDIRPGLLKTQKEKRELVMLKWKEELENTYKDQKRSKISNKEIEEEKRQEGLNKPIDESNKGFALLQKMGYIPGSGIGKTDNKPTNLIDIKVKSNRKGIGTEEPNQKKFNSSNTRNKINTKSDLTLEKLIEYRENCSRRINHKYIENDLYKSQKICYQFDMKNNFEEPKILYYWPNYVDTHGDEEDHIEDDDEQDGLRIEEKLVALTNYLRTKYYYCIWCATEFSSQDDIELNCPGPDRVCH